VSGNGELEMNCGEGEDAVAIAFADDPPGPVVPEDCETIEITRASPRPSAVTRRAITFAASGSQDGYGRNTATMELTWRGKVVSTRRFRAGGRAVPVKLALPRALARAMKRAPQTVGVTVRHYLWDRDGVGEDYDPTSFTWRVRVSR
jgi:hypothetical protein